MVKIISPPVLLPAAGYFLTGFFLAGAGLAGVPLPMGVCLIAALSGEKPAAGGAVWLGIMVSCLLFQWLQAALLTWTAGMLILAAAWAFQGTQLVHKAGWPVLSSAIGGGLVALLCLFAAPVNIGTWVAFGLQMLTFTVGTAVTCRFLSKPQKATMLPALFGLISGAGAMVLPGEIPVGAILAGTAVFSLASEPTALPLAAMAGLALDSRYTHGISAVPLLVAAALATGGMHRLRSRKIFRFGAGIGAAGVMLILSGGKNSATWIALALGGILSLVLPPLPFLAEKKDRTAGNPRLEQAAKALEKIASAAVSCPEPPQSEIGRIYDRAAGKVCTTCAGFVRCWKQTEENTCRVFCAAAPALTARGSARREDFPASFSGDCRHFSELLLAIDRELDAAALRRQWEHRRRELQQITADQYRILSRYCRRLARSGREPETAYSVDWASRGQGKQAVSGDRSRCFSLDCHCYVLLCDGMGTGPEAAADSTAAVELLTDLLQGGMASADVLTLFGNALVLGEQGGATTVDLADIDLSDGSGVLYKWGSSASYMKQGEKIQKIGTTSCPPGLHVGETQQAEEFRLSLTRGEMLVLTTDGIGGEEAEALLHQTGQIAVAELAAGLAVCGSTEGEDDRTAVVLQLRPVSAP